MELNGWRGLWCCVQTLLALSKGAVPYAEIHTRLPALHMAACFFLGAARGLHYLTATDGSALGSLSVELSIGDVHAMFDQQEEEEGHGESRMGGHREGIRALTSKGWRMQPIYHRQAQRMAA